MPASTTTPFLSSDFCLFFCFFFLETTFTPSTLALVLVFLFDADASAPFWRLRLVVFVLLLAGVVTREEDDWLGVARWTCPPF